jgi:hypothetical protein
LLITDQRECEERLRDEQQPAARLVRERKRKSEEKKNTQNTATKRKKKKRDVRVTDNMEEVPPRKITFSI